MLFRSGVVSRNLAYDLGDGSSTVGSSTNLGWATRNAIEWTAYREESLRLFYVATTRARDWLILSSADEITSKKKTPAFRLLTDRFDLATGALRVDLPEGLGVPRVDARIVVAESDEARPTRGREGQVDPRVIIDVIKRGTRS